MPPDADRAVQATGEEELQNLSEVRRKSGL